MAWYRKFITFAPAGEQLAEIAACLDVACEIGDTLLKAFVLGAMFYIGIEFVHGLLRHFGAL